MRRGRPSPLAVIAVTCAAQILAGCGQSRESAAPAHVETAAAPDDQSRLRALGYVAPQPAAKGAGGEQPAAPGGAATTPGRAPAPLKLIRTAQITIEVATFDEAATAAARIAGQHGGYVADSQVTRAGEGRRRGVLTLRISADRFDGAMAALRALGSVGTESVSAQDVTKAYYDLENRLRVKQQTAERLRQILKARTSSLSDVLQAEQALARVVEEAEQLEGERRFFDQQVALSTITATLHEPRALVRPGFTAPIVEALRESVHVLAASVAGVVYAAVFLAPWLLVLWVLWRLVRAARRRRRSAAAPPAAPTSGDTPGGRA